MKKTSLFAAVAVALALSAQASAHDHSACLDQACDTQALFHIEEGKTGGSATDTDAAKRYGTWGIDTDGMDRAVRPGQDFFRYVSGNWAEDTAIPADRSSYGNFAVLRDL